MILVLDYQLETWVDQKHGWNRSRWNSLIKCDNCGENRTVIRSLVASGVAGRLCQPCSVSIAAKRNLSSKPQEYIKFQQESGFTLLDGVPHNGQTKVRWKCPLGHETLNSLNQLKAGGKCNFCSQRRPKTESDYYNLAKQFNVTFIGPTPSGINIPTNWICHCGKPISTAYVNIRKNKFCYNCGLKKITGPNHVMYNPFLTKEDREKGRIYGAQLDKWRKAVYKKFNCTCQKCHTRTKCHAHHIFSWNSYEDLRFVVENGICLCPSCHRTFHNTYGSGNNNVDQLEEFIEIQLHLCSLLNQ